MSTWMYLKCVDHDPPLLADDESGQHWHDLPRIRDEIANRTDLVARLEADELSFRGLYYDVNEYFARNSARFLRQHPQCNVGIETEYGQDVTEPSDGE